VCGVEAAVDVGVRDAAWPRDMRMGLRIPAKATKPARPKAHPSVYLIAGTSTSSTPATLADHLPTCRPRRHYPSDTGDTEWAILAPHVPAGTGRGRPISYPRRSSRPAAALSGSEGRPDADGRDRGRRRWPASPAGRIRTWPSSSGNVFGSLRFSIWRDRAGDYVRRLMLDGRRKSIQPMAARLHGRTSRRCTIS